MGIVCSLLTVDEEMITHVSPSFFSVKRIAVLALIALFLILQLLQVISKRRKEKQQQESSECLHYDRGDCTHAKGSLIRYQCPKGCRYFSLNGDIRPSFVDSIIALVLFILPVILAFLDFL